MAIINNPRTLDLEDVQGTIVRGYGSLLKTAYFLIRVNDPSKAKAWIKSILPHVDSANPENRKEKTLHLAFAHNGLQALGLNKKTLENFPVPFREGMVTEDRSRILGDYGTNAPDQWYWGGENDEHMVLIFHAKDDESLAAFMTEQRQAIEQNGGLDITLEMLGYLRPDNKEPFGFHDGISQPVIKGSGRPGPEIDFVATGEFLMGHKNEYDQYPYSPLLLEDQGNMALLHDDAAGSGKKDLGHNGTFMVYRQIQQHVDRFHEYMREQTKRPDGSTDEKAARKLAAKCVGRWPSGASLVHFPDEDPEVSVKDADFGYADTDPEGLKCPYGSHLRRNNPRDAFRWYGKKQSLKISRRHRIIRRGRTYELPAKEGEEQGEIGLHFICFNANLQLQFEFIQHAWANNNQLRHLNNDVDVIIGVPAEGDPNNGQRKFTIQAEPANEFVDNLELFTTIKGGAYYFVPSISVLNYLSTI